MFGLDEIIVKLLNNAVIDGKSMFYPITRILKLLFFICISSFFFECFYGSYYWLDIQDYKSILDFFVRGQFFIPVFVFLIVCFIISLLSTFLFTTINNKWMRRFESFLLKKIRDDNGQIDNFFLQLYAAIKKQVKPDLLENFNLIVKKSNKDIVIIFDLVFEIFIASTIFIFQLTQFNGLLYIIVLFFLLLVLAASFLINSFFNVIHHMKLELDKNYPQENNKFMYIKIIFKKTKP